MNKIYTKWRHSL